MTLPVVLDCIVIALLIATIPYTFILNRKLSSLYKEKEELRHFLETFAESLAQAKTGVEHLKKVSLESSQELQDKIRHAKILHNELIIFMKNAEKIVTHLNSPTSLSSLSNSSSHHLSNLDERKALSSELSPQTPISRTSSLKVEPRLVQALRGLK